MTISPFISIPILAGIALCSGGLGAVLLDLLEQRRNERILSEQQNRAPNTVLIRMLSYVTGDPTTSCKAYIFIIGCFLYAVLGGFTGYLQSEALVDNYYNEDEEIMKSKTNTKGVQLVVYPIIIGLSGMLLVLGVRLLPYDKYPRAGIATHVIVAGLLQMFSIIYSFTAVGLAIDIFGEASTITTVRKVFTYISVIGLVLSFLLGGYVMGKSAQLTQHEKAIQSNANGGTLTSKQVWSIKCWMAGLGLIQMSIGISTGVVTASGAAEINLLANIDGIY